MHDFLWIGVRDLFKVGIGPSSSHTVGPMIAARRFAEALRDCAPDARVGQLRVELYGSLGATGKGHGTDKAVMLGLEGDAPETVDVDSIPVRLAEIAERGRIQLHGKGPTAFQPARDLVFHRRDRLPAHSNGMRFTAFNDHAQPILERTYYSVGGGFVTEDGKGGPVPDRGNGVPYPFYSGVELLETCARTSMPIAALMRHNEEASSPGINLESALLDIWRVMEACIARGSRTPGVLPGGLKVKRRAPLLFAQLADKRVEDDPLVLMDWVSAFAIAVNEENAAGGRVVTAPTNGAAGIIPAVLMYARRFCRADDNAVVDFLLTAAAIGTLYKRNASISGAEVGCQGEVGVASSMAAAGLAALMGGSPPQVEYAAEIAMEHHLGLTCDPVGGLVQIPCIERNAVGAVKAIQAARMALSSDGNHYVSLDKVIKTMRETGADMQDKYKETARGGLALNVIEC